MLENHAVNSESPSTLTTKSNPHHHDPTADHDDTEPLPFDIRSPEEHDPNSLGTFRFDEAPSYMNFREESSTDTPPQDVSTHFTPTVMMTPSQSSGSNDAMQPLHLSETAPAAAKRKASATIVMQGGGPSAKKEDASPEARAALAAVSSQPSSAPNSPSKRMYSLGTVQFKAAALVEVIQKTLTSTDVPCNTDSNRSKGPPTSLPSELKVPMSLRCDFCQKFDSVCSQCHFRWKGISESRRIVFQNQFKSLTLERRVATLFSTIAYGEVGFAKVIFEPLATTTVTATTAATGGGGGGGAMSLNTVLDELEAEFTPFAFTDGGEAVAEQYAAQQRKFSTAGAVFPLHVACGMNRLQMAKLLLTLGVTPCRSSSRVSPFDLLPSPLPAEWESMLNEFPSYRHFVACDKARALRSENRLEEALAVYDAVLEENAFHELARCGRAKTLYDLNRYQDCIRACDELTADEGKIKWLQNVPANVELLRTEAADQFCDVSHADATCSCALKACGCIIIPESFRVSVRRLPFAILRDEIFSFCDCKILWSLRRATRAPLMHRTTELLASSQGIDSIGAMLAGEFGYREMYDTIVAETPDVASGRDALLKGPTVFLALQVIAMADFHTFLLRAAVVGGNPKYVAEGSFFSFGKRSEETKRSHLVVLKQFRVNRAGIGKAWEVARAGEWEVDLATTDIWLKTMHHRAAKANSP